MVVRLTPHAAVLAVAGVAIASDISNWARMIWMLVAVVAGYVARHSLMRALTRRASLSVDAQTLTITHPLLREAIEIPRDYVRAVAIDEGPIKKGRFEVRSSFRFGTPDQPQVNRGKLLMRVRKRNTIQLGPESMFPFLGTVIQHANVAIAFRGPVALPVRPGWQRFRGDAPQFGKLGPPTLVVLVPMHDVGQVERIFADWNVTRGLVEDDLLADRPPRECSGTQQQLHAPNSEIGVAPSEGSRLALALTLAAGYYVLWIAFVLGSVALSVLFWVADGPVGKIRAVGCALAALLGILVLIPTRTHQQEPGLAVTPTMQPRLWDLVRRVAMAVGEPVPHEVVIIRAPNAYVHESGGFKNARVLALGLPLLATLTERELMSIIAHEFGHFSGGDTRIGKVVALTHRELYRTIEARYDDGVAWWEKSNPFVQYFRFFLRVTGTMRRRQEFNADQVAATIAGAPATRQAAIKAVMTNLAFETFWAGEMAPALECGRRPPLMDGLQRFIRQPLTAASLVEHTDATIATERYSPYDSHPPTRDRLRNIGEDPSAPPDDSAPARKLLRNVDVLERDVLIEEFDDDRIATMPLIDWDDVVPTVFLGPWRHHVREIAHRLSDITIGDIPRHTTSPVDFARRMGAADPRELAPELALAGLVQTLGMALCVALADAGFDVGGEPGGNVIARRGAAAIAPYEVIERMADGAIDPQRWRTECERHGVADITLGAPVEAVGAPESTAEQTFAHEPAHVDRPLASPIH